MAAGWNSSIIDFWKEEDRQYDEYLERRKTFVGAPKPDSFEGTEMAIIRKYTDKQIANCEHITFDIPSRFKKEV